MIDHIAFRNLRLIVYFELVVLDKGAPSLLSKLEIIENSLFLILHVGYVQVGELR